MFKFFKLSSIREVSSSSVLSNVMQERLLRNEEFSRSSSSLHLIVLVHFCDSGSSSDSFVLKNFSKSSRVSLFDSHIFKLNTSFIEEIAL